MADTTSKTYDWATLVRAHEGAAMLEPRESPLVFDPESDDIPF